ncbi:MAG TPA: hypothetical protein VF403_26915 [Kofleriaceae bacterium]
MRRRDVWVLALINALPRFAASSRIFLNMSSSEVMESCIAIMVPISMYRRDGIAP